VATAPLVGDPGDIRLDAGLGYLFVVLPQSDALQIIDTRDLSTVRVIPELSHVTGLALDQSRHTLFVSHIEGLITLLDATSGDVTSRWIVSGSGLAGLAYAADHVFAVNAPENALVDVNMATNEAMRTSLGVEPGAVAVGSQSGAVYVLGVDANAIVKLDAQGGVEVARASLGDDAPAVASDLKPETAWVRPRMVVSASDERAYVIEPEAAVLGMSPPAF
jgi:DNA-binding beta-propeller fold protein YncE